MYRSSSTHKMNESLKLNASKITFLNYLTQQTDKKTNKHIKQSIYWDKEHLYQQNLMLRSKIKEIADSSAKTKAKLVKTQRNIHELALQNKNQKISDSVYRTASASMTSFKRRPISGYKQDQNVQGTFINALKKNIQQLKEKLELLKSQNDSLKRSIKHTRMSELQTQNKQLQQENIRLYNASMQSRRLEEEAQMLLRNQIQQNMQKLRKQNDAKVQLMKQLKIARTQLEEMNHYCKKIQAQMQLKINRLTAQLQKYKGINIVYKNLEKSQPSVQEDYLKFQSTNKLNYSNSPSAFERIQAKVAVPGSERLLSSGDFLLTQSKFPQNVYNLDLKQPQSVSLPSQDKYQIVNLDSKTDQEENRVMSKQMQQPEVRQQKPQEKGYVQALMKQDYAAESIQNDASEQIQSEQEIIQEDPIQQQQYIQEFQTDEKQQEKQRNQSVTTAAKLKSLYLPQDYDQQDLQRL